MTDAEMAEMANAQARCDSVAVAFGRVAHPPMPGETPIAYRRRLANGFKAHSARWKEIELQSLNSAVLANAEDDIYKDAASAARDPTTVPAGTLRAVRTPRPGGGYMTEFVGDPDVWMMAFKPPVKSRAILKDPD